MSTGKSTLVEDAAPELARRLGREFVVLDEAARRVIALGHRLDREGTVEAYAQYIVEQLRAERGAAAVTHVLSDRCLLDLLAYVRHNADSRIPQSFERMLEEIVWREVEYFDVFCHLPIEFPLVPDGVRDPDEAYRSAVDGALTQLWVEYGVEPVRIAGPRSDRAQRLQRFFD